MHPLPRLPILPVALGVFVSAVAGLGHRAVAQPSEPTPALEPYSVFVVQDEAFTRCGPSPDYYRTDRLRHGQQLEVYVETEDDWLGVRPPEESFCWVPASAVQMEENGEFGEVIEDKTVAWIGTHLGRARRYRWQVQMAEGEAVSVIGRSERDGPDGPQLWYRIVPPSGEFRWIHRDDVVESAEELVASVEQKQRGRTDSEAAPDTGDLAESDEPTLADVPRVEKRPRRAPEPPELAFDDGSSRRTTADQRLGGGRLEATPAVQTGRSVLRGAAARQGGSAAADPVGSTADASRGVAVGSGLRRPQPAPADRSAAADGWTFAQSDENRRARGTAAGGVAPAAAEAPIDRIAANSAHPAPLGGVDRAGPIGRAGGLAPLAERSPEAAAAAERLRRELRDADLGQMQLVLSRLMARRASAAEIEPVIEAASRRAASTSEEVTSVRAEMLAQRAREYQQVAHRRGTPLPQPVRGGAVIPASAETALSIPATIAPVAEPPRAPGAPAENTVNAKDTDNSVPSGNAADRFLESGYLVQVYSARPNSPPFALTDATGRTVAYVTPSPGVNLRTHLNSEIRVAGTPGFLQGLNTPHILVTRAVRTQP